MQLNWYAIKAITGQEKKIKTFLETEINRQKLQNYISEILIPVEKVYEERKGKRYVREKKIFGGYIFIFADISHGEVLHTVNYTPGVLGFVGSKDKTDKNPTPLRQNEINRILGKMEEAEGALIKQNILFSPGQAVKVIDGPFTGFFATVQEVFEERKKINVIVKIFGRNTPVELNYSQAEKES